MDILADLKSFACVLALMQAYRAEVGARLVQVIQYERHGWYFCLAWLDAQHQVSWLSVDFCLDFCQDARCFLSGGEVLEGRGRVSEGLPAGGYYVPRPAIQFIYYAIKRIDKGLLTPAQAGSLEAWRRQDPVGAQRQLARFWPAPDARLLAAAARSGDWTLVLPAVARLRLSLHQRVSISLWGRYEEARLRWRRLCAPPGLAVGLAGGTPGLRRAVTATLQTTFAPAFYHFQVVSSHPPALPDSMAAKGSDALPRSRLRHRLDLGRAALIVFTTDVLDPRAGDRHAPDLSAAHPARLFGPTPDLCLFLDRESRPEPTFAASRPWVRVDASRQLEAIAREVEVRVLAFLDHRLRLRAGLPACPATLSPCLSGEARPD